MDGVCSYLHLWDPKLKGLEVIFKIVQICYLYDNELYGHLGDKPFGRQTFGRQDV